MAVRAVCISQVFEDHVFTKSRTRSCPFFLPAGQDPVLNFAFPFPQLFPVGMYFNRLSQALSQYNPINYVHVELWEKKKPFVMICMYFLNLVISSQGTFCVPCTPCSSAEPEVIIFNIRKSNRFQNTLLFSQSDE